MCNDPVAIPRIQCNTLFQLISLPYHNLINCKVTVVPEKFGAISNPFPRYPAVTAPLTVKAIVKKVMEAARSHPRNI